MPNQSADLIEAQATAHEADVIRRTGDELLVVVRLRCADGRVMNYRLLIDAGSSHVKAREAIAERLPGYCPTRHINHDGTFCMNWQKGEPLLIADGATAERWWGTLLEYLRSQELANRRRRWPTAEWAHGHAAEHQQKAERYAKVLGPTFEAALAANRLKVRKSGRDFLGVFDAGRRIYSIWSGPRRVATLRQRCVCRQSRLPLSSCRDHAQAAADLGVALKNWEEAEAKFWAQAIASGQSCCGTMSDCPLAGLHSAPAEDLKIAA